MSEQLRGLLDAARIVVLTYDRSGGSDHEHAVNDLHALLNVLDPLPPIFDRSTT